MSKFNRELDELTRITEEMGGYPELHSDYDVWKELGKALTDAGARVTFDAGRNYTYPCFWCDETEAPRTLTKIGSYIISTGGGILPKDSLIRPLCESCRALTE